MSNGNRLATSYGVNLASPGTLTLIPTADGSTGVAEKNNIVGNDCGLGASPGFSATSNLRHRPRS